MLQTTPTDTLEPTTAPLRDGHAVDPSVPTPPAPARDVPVTIIEPQRGWVSLNLPELWQYRDLLIQFVLRDFSARYRQSVLGITWAVINPLLQMCMYTLVFGKMAKFPTGGIPYPVFSFAGLLPWMYFSGCLSKSSTSAVGGSALLTKVYFPRLILPLSKVTNGLIDFGIQLVILLGLMAVYGVTPTAAIIFVPLFLVLCAVSALSVGLWITALGVKYRDVNNLVGFVARMWMWVTPVVYSFEMVPEKWRLWFSLNPMTGVVEGFRWALLGTPMPDWTLMAVSSSVSVLLLVGGLYYFRRTEASFADVI